MTSCRSPRRRPGGDSWPPQAVPPQAAANPRSKPEPRTPVATYLHSYNTKLQQGRFVNDSSEKAGPKAANGRAKTNAAKAHRGMRHERRLDLRRADVVARHHDDVVDAARDPVVAVRVAPRAVARQVVAVVAEVRVLEPARRRRAASMALSETEGPRVERQVQKRRPRRARWSRPTTRAPPSSP